MVQYLTNLAAVFIVDRLGRAGVAEENRVLRLAGCKNQIVVVPAKQDRLEKDGKDAQARRQLGGGFARKDKPAGHLSPASRGAIFASLSEDSDSSIDSASYLRNLFAL